MKPFILDQKARHYFSGFIVLLSISSHQYTSQLAHRSPGTEQSTWWVTKARMHWAYIHLLERTVLTPASREAAKSETTGLWAQAEVQLYHTLQNVFIFQLWVLQKIIMKGQTMQLSWSRQGLPHPGSSLTPVLLACLLTSLGRRRTSVTLMTATSEWL